MERGFLEKDKKNKSYTWKLTEKEKESFFKIVESETKSLSNFISKILKDFRPQYESEVTKKLLN